MSEMVAIKLERREEIESRVMGNALEIGALLREARDDELFRPDYSSFSAWVQDRFGYSKSYASRLVNTHEIRVHLGAVSPVRANLKQLTALLPVPKENWGEVWLATLQESENRGCKLSARLANEVACDLVPGLAEKKAKRRRKQKAVPKAKPSKGDSELQENNGTPIVIKQADEPKAEPASETPSGESKPELGVHVEIESEGVVESVVDVVASASAEIKGKVHTAATAVMREYSEPASQQSSQSLVDQVMELVSQCSTEEVAAIVTDIRRGYPEAFPKEVAEAEPVGDDGFGLAWNPRDAELKGKLIKSEDFKGAWYRWCDHHDSLGNPLEEGQCQRHVDHLKKKSVADAIGCIDGAIEAGDVEPLVRVSRAAKRKKFEKPTRGQVAAYCEESELRLSLDKFFDHYDSNGWMIGKNPMVDWKATVRKAAREWAQPETGEVASDGKVAMNFQPKKRNGAPVSDAYKAGYEPGGI